MAKLLKRLSYKDASGNWVIACNQFWNYIKLKLPAHLKGNAVDRLAQIEDILGETYDLDQLRELVEADKVGKILVSPCNIGDTVYILHCGKCPHLNSATVSGIHLRDETYRGGKKRREYVVVRKNGFSKHLPIDKIGKMWFLHEHAAKAALAKEENRNV